MGRYCKFFIFWFYFLCLIPFHNRSIRILFNIVSHFICDIFSFYIWYVLILFLISFLIYFYFFSFYVFKYSNHFNIQFPILFWTPITILFWKCIPALLRIPIPILFWIRFLIHTEHLLWFNSSSFLFQFWNFFSIYHTYIPILFSTPIAILFWIITPTLFWIPIPR